MVVAVVDVVLVGVVVAVDKHGSKFKPRVAVIEAMVDAKPSASSRSHATSTSPSRANSALAAAWFAMTASSSSGTAEIFGCGPGRSLGGTVAA